MSELLAGSSSTGRLHIGLIVAGVLVGVACTSMPAMASEEYDKAHELYIDAEFEEALEFASAQLVSRVLNRQDRLDLTVLTARCLVALRRTGEAMTAFCDALNVDPDWTPDPDVMPQDELTTFRDAQESCVPPLEMIDLAAPHIGEGTRTGPGRTRLLLASGVTVVTGTAWIWAIGQENSKWDDYEIFVRSEYDPDNESSVSRSDALYEEYGDANTRTLVIGAVALVSLAWAGWETYRSLHNDPESPSTASQPGGPSSSLAANNTVWSCALPTSSGDSWGIAVQIRY